MNFHDKMVLVTGGGAGIGAAITRRFVTEGALVVICDIDPGPAEVLAAEVSSIGPGRAVVMALDVGDAQAWKAVAGEICAKHGGIDVLVNNAGIYQNLPLDEISEAAWDQMMTVNAKGPFLGTRAVMAAMRARGGGAIVNISSMAPDIRCNSVHPGMVETEMARAAVETPGARQGRLARIPMARFGDPSEIANVVVFLASDEASFMTGAEIAVDGGCAVA